MSKGSSSVAERAFVVPVGKLRRLHGTRRHEVRSGVIEDLCCTGSGVPQDAAVEADVVLESVGGGVSVTGHVSAGWEGQCVRCLAPASGQIRVRVLEHFTEDGDGSDTYRLSSDEVDLEPMVHDAVLLELPQAPLCRADCLGLCPVCGAELNISGCGCERSAPDPRWAALGDLQFFESGGDPGPGGS